VVEMRLRVKGVTVLLLLDLVLAGTILYVQVADHGGITLDLRTTTVVITTTVVSLQAPYAQVNVTSVSCAVSTRSCSISLSNDGNEDVQLTACVFQQFDGGVGTLSSNAGLPGNSQTSVDCTAPLDMTGIQPGSKVLGALFLVRGNPLAWTGVWH
jgi:hypothetical protein